MKLLVESGASLEARSKSEISPLIACVMKNRVPIADYLLTKGARIDLTSKMSAMQEIIQGMSFDMKVIFNNHISIPFFGWPQPQKWIEWRSLKKILYAYNNRKTVPEENWPELFKLAEKCPHVLRFACAYLAEKFYLDECLVVVNDLK